MVSVLCSISPLDIDEFFIRRKGHLLYLSKDKFSKIIKDFKHNSKHSFTFYSGEGHPICLAGISEINQSTCQIWMCCSVDIEDYKIGFTKRCKELLRYNLGYNRIQADVEATKFNWIKWMNHMGFGSEGIMNHFYGHNNHALMMRKIKEDLEPI